MSAPNAPMPLGNQVKASSSLVVTVVLRGLGPAPAFLDGGATFNASDPTATFTMTTPAAGAALTSNRASALLDMVELMWREGDFTVT